jgi:dihydrodipicolinate synthase/N-acetylneuraminate lyase
MNNREVLEGLIEQGISEAWRYTIDTTPVAGTATGTPTLTVYDEKDQRDVTSDLVTGSCTLSAGVITTGIISALQLNRTYQCLVRWDVGASQFRSRYFRLRGAR